MDEVIRYLARDALAESLKQAIAKNEPGMWVRAADFDERQAQGKQREVALQDRLTAAEQQLDERSGNCEWEDEDGVGTWHSACGVVWSFHEDGPVENGMNFCHSCGKAVVIPITGEATKPEIAPEGWVPCSPEWLKSGGDCATAQRWSSKAWDGHSHWHPAHVASCTTRSDCDIPDFSPGNGNKAKRRMLAIEALKPENQRIVPCNPDANEPPCTACFDRGCNGECMENM